MLYNVYPALHVHVNVHMLIVQIHDCISSNVYACVHAGIPLLEIVTVILISLLVVLYM